MRYKVNKEVKIGGQRYSPGDELEADADNRDVKVFAKIGRIEPVSHVEPEQMRAPAPKATSSVTEIVETAGDAGGVVEAAGIAEGIGGEKSAEYERRDMRARKRKPE